MKHRPVRLPLGAVPARVLAPLVVAVATAACGLSDVFAAAGVEDVRFVWESDSVLQVGEVVPIRVSVLVADQPMESPRIVVAIPDTVYIAPNATGDSLVARRVGRGDVLVGLLSSVATGLSADTSFEIRVLGGPPVP